MSVNGLFHVPEKPYFLSHSVGCLPTSSESKLAENFLAPWKSSGGDAWGPWLGLIDDFCHGIPEHDRTLLLIPCSEETIETLYGRYKSCEGLALCKTFVIFIGAKKKKNEKLQIPFRVY